MTNETKVLILYRPNYRSTLWTQFYRYCRDHPTDEIKYTLLHDTLDGWGKARLDKYDVIISGARASGSLTYYEGDVPTVYQVVDIENVFGTGLFPARPEIEEYLACQDWNAVWWDGSDKCYSALDRLHDGMQDHPCVQGSDLWCIPHAIDPQIYRPPLNYSSKDIDVVACWSQDAGAYHGFRQLISETLAKAAMIRVQDEQTGEPKMMERYKYFRGVVPEPRRYRNMLMRTYFGMADTAGRGAQTAKYLEIAMCGGVIVGEKPEGYDELYENGVTFVELDYDNLSKSFGSFLDDWLFKRELIKDRLYAMQKQMSERVLKHHHPDVIKAELDRKVWELV